MSNSLQPYELQHARPPCPSPTPGVYSNSCPLSQWCHPTISSSVTLFSSCLQSFPASGSFQMSQLFASGGQSTGVSASTSVLPMNIQSWFPLRLTGLISLQSKGLSRVFLQHHSLKASIFWCLAFFTAQLSHPHREKANRVLPRECTGHRKHPSPRSYQVSLTQFSGFWRIHKSCVRDERLLRAWAGASAQHFHWLPGLPPLLSWWKRSRWYQQRKGKRNPRLEKPGVFIMSNKPFS